MHVSPLRQKPSPSGKVSALPTEEVIAFLFGKGVGFADRRGHSLPFRGRCRLCRRKRFMRQKVFPLGGLYVSFYLIWGKCRCRETLLSIEIQYDKKCPPSAEFNISSELNWEECRRRDLIFNKNTQNGKEGLPQT